MKFVVDRKTWFRGKGSDESYLLLADGTRCCIGFVGQQCGIPDKSLLNRAAIYSFTTDAPNVEIQIWPAWMQQDGAIDEAYEANDDESLSDSEREATLKALFTRHGDEIEFVG